jgi:amino acid transporter
VRNALTDEFARQARGGGWWGAVGFAAIWIVFIGAVTAVIAVGAARQVATASWPTADGTVTVSREAARRGRGGAGWELEYTYTVAGRDYTGRRYAHDPMPVQARDVERAIAAHPPGSAVAVSYDPADPAEAVIRPGLRGCTLWVAMFVTPFVLIGLGMAAGIAGRHRRRFDPADRRYVVPTDAGAVARLDPPSRVTAFLVCLFAATFGTAWTVFTVGFGVGVGYWLTDGLVMDPPAWVPALGWLAVLAGSTVAALRLVSAAPTLTADTTRRVLVLAAKGPAGPATEVPFAAVREVRVVPRERRANRTTYTAYRVQLDRADGGPLTLAEYDAGPDADALAGWVRDRVA